MKIFATKIHIYLFFLLFFIHNEGWTQSDFTANKESPIDITERVDKTEIYIGDLITYSVIVTHDEDLEILLPSLGANLGGFEIRDYQEFEPRIENGKVVHQVDYIISTFDVGEFEIPPISVGYKIPPDTAEKFLKTQNIQIKVESLKPSEDGDIREIKPPWEISYNWKPIVIIALLVLFGILFIIGLIYIIRKRKKGEAILPKKLEPQKPPHEIAYKELQNLADSDLLKNGKIKGYYSEISDIIRRYIEGRYQIIAMEMTTTEVLDQLRTTEIEENHFELFVRFLEACDMVKFAKYLPDDNENKEIMSLAIHIIDKTKWQEIVTEPEAEISDSSAAQKSEQTDQEKVEENNIENKSVSKADVIEQKKKDVKE